MAKKRDDEFYKIVKEHLGSPSDAERAERRMNGYNKQNKATKQATIVKSTNNKKINVKTYIPKSTNTNSNNSSNNHSVINSNDLSKMENNYFNNYVSQHNYNDENVRVFTKERNQKKANELKSNINEIIQNRSNNNRLAELEVAKSKLKKKDGNGSTVEYLGEDYKKIEENKTKRKQIEDEQEAIKSGVYNAPKKIGNDDLSSAWLIHNTKENLEKNAEKALHDENIKLNNQQSKLRNAVYDTLTQDTRDKISQEQKAKVEERKRDMELQGFDNYQDMVDYNDSWKGTLSYIGRSLANSLHNFNKNVTTDVRDFFGIRNELNDLGLGFINDIADYYGDVADKDNEYLASKTKYVGTGTRLAGEGTQILAQMTPQIAFALLSGGSSTAISAGEAIGNASTSAKVVSSIKTMAKQPTFWTTVIQEGGNAYEEAINSGASQEEAQLSAIYTGLMNGAIEMGGGLEDGAKKGIKNWLKQGSDEGLEEVKQDFVSGLVSKGVYDNDKPMYSTEDDNAVLNPANELKAYLGGFFGGTVGSGIQRGAVKAFNKAQNAHQNKKLTNFYDKLIQSESPSENLIENTNQTEITEAPSVEAVISEAETNQETAKRISKVIDKIDKGETVTNSEIAELKYNKTASNMIEQMAGLKESKIISALDNDTVREVINEAQNGKKNIDTASMLGNIRSNLNLTQNIAENTNENSSDAVLNADKGKLTGINKNAVESISEPYNASQSNEVGEAMPENIVRNAKKNYINNIEADNLTASEETAALNDSPYIENVLNNDSNSYNKVENDSNKIFKLGISNKRSGMTNIRKVQSIDNGVAQLLMSNGDVVSADALDFSNNQNAEIILKNAGKYNSSTANTFIANYDSSRSTPQAYSTAFNSVYKMSKAGMSFDAVASEASAARGILGENSFNAAIRAGRNTAKGVFSDNTSSNAKNTAKTKMTDEVSRTDKSASKLITSSAKKNISEKSNTVKANKIDVKKSAKEFSKALGVKINVYQSDTYIRGYEKNGEIFVNESWVNKKANSASEFNYILAHEITHTLEESDYYNQLKSFILNSRVYDDSLKLRDTTHTEEVRNRQELYGKYGKELTKEQAERELIADFIADELLTNEECIKELAYKDKKLFVKIKEFLNKMIDTLKRFVKNSSDITQAQKDLIHIKQLYKKAFDDVKKNGTYSNEIKYSKKLGGYNPDINVSTKNIANVFGIEDINNLSEVQRKVYNKLLDSYISTSTQSKPIINIDTGMKIEIWKKGINETFGNHSAYRNIPQNMKKAKLATMTNLAKMIKYGEVRSPESRNYHNPNSSVTFAYLTSPITIDGKKYNVNMDIRKTRQGNRFYIHKIKIADEVSRTDQSAFKLITSPANNNISQNDNTVNSNILKNSDSDTKFSIDPKFISDYDNWDKKNQYKVFILGKTSNALKSIGLSDKTITMDSSKILKIKKKHSAMTDNIIKDIPKVLENPVAIMKSKTKNNRITMFGSLTDTDGKPVLAVLELNPMKYGYKLDEYKVASAYGKDNLQNLIDTSEMLYVDNKKRTTDLLNETRLQLPSTFNKSSSLKNIVSNNNTNVNNSILENSDSDTKFSLDDDLKNLNDKYGTKKKGENPVRDIDVPEKSSDNKRVREFVKTILESDALTDEMVNEVSHELVKDTLSYEPISNENVLKVANEWLDNNGKGVTEKHWRDWEVISDRGHKVTALDVAKGELLLKSAAQNNDTQKVLKLTAEISEMATAAGQTVQAMRLLKKSTGLGQLYYAEKTVRRMNIDYETKYAKKGKEAPQIKINEDLALELAQAKTETQKEVAADKLYKDIGEQVPSNWVDKWNAWRYMSMLTNPTTHIRNVVGNGIFMPAVATKNAIAYGLETAFLRNGQEKTKTIKVRDEYKTFAEQDFDYVEAELTGNGKYEPTDMIQSNKAIFKNKFLEGIRNLNGNLLEAEDAIFLKHHYKRAFSMYLQANKIALNELSDVNAENARKAAIDKGRIYAIKEAQKATYRDASKLADAISQFAKSHKAAGVVVEGVIPFKKTPINVAKRAVEYSPAGLIKAFTYDIAKLRHGEISVGEYIDRISAGITGTGLTALGLFLGHLGLIKVGLGGDDKEQGLKKLEGHQEYSIELFGYSYTFDWACPAAIPIFIGAKAGEMLNDENEGLTFADYEDLTTTMLDPMFEMSVLSGIDNMINNVKFSKSPVVDTGLYAVSSYLGQAVPTLGGKIAGTIDGTRRSSYIDKSKDTFVSKNFTSSQQQFVNKIVKKIPGATYLLEPYVNEWGEQEKQDNVGVRIFQNFISPGYISKIEVDEVEKMLEDTYKESGNNTVLPTKSKKYFSVNGDTVHLNADEYTTYATVRGQMAHSILKDLSNNDDFKSAESADKASLISKAYELSNAIAKQGVSDYKPDGWINKATEANEKGMSYSDFLVMRESLNEISGEGTKEKRYNKIRRMNINKSAKEALWKSFNYDMSLGGEKIYFY